MAPSPDDQRRAMVAGRTHGIRDRVRPAAAIGAQPGTGTLRDRLEKDRLRHRVTKLESVVVALRSRARAYDQPPDALRLALADFQAQLDAARARIDRGPTAADVARLLRDAGP